jgi:hypothetical protein
MVTPAGEVAGLVQASRSRLGSAFLAIQNYCQPCSRAMRSRPIIRARSALLARNQCAGPEAVFSVRDTADRAGARIVICSWHISRPQTVNVLSSGTRSRVAEALGLREYLLRMVAFQKSLGWGIGAHWPSGCIIPVSLLWRNSHDQGNSDCCRVLGVLRRGYRTSRLYCVPITARWSRVSHLRT